MMSGDSMLEMLANNILELERLSELESNQIIAQLEKENLPSPSTESVHHTSVELERFQHVSEEDSIRKRDGTEYKPGILTSIQYSLDRYLKEKKVEFSIKKDSQFSHSNQVLASKRKNLKAQGKGNLKSKAEPLTAEEIQILRDKNLLGKADPVMLLQTVWKNNGVYFGMRGRQDHTNLLWGDIELKRSLDGREYLEFTGIYTHWLNCFK